jgi:hypothetical protein
MALMLLGAADGLLLMRQPIRSGKSRIFRTNGFRRTGNAISSLPGTSVVAFCAAVAAD